MSALRRNSVSPAKASWELDWQGTDNILKIAMFDEEKNNFSKTKEVPKEIRERIRKLEKERIFSRSLQRKMRLRSKKNEPMSDEVQDGLFKRLSKCVFLLIRCFNARKKNAIPREEFVIASYDYDSETSDRSSINLEFKKILTSPPSLRAAKDLRKVASFLRASGAAVAIMGPTNVADDENLARCVSYERYQNGRILAQQGRHLDRFYFILRGKVLLVKEYHLGNSVISKTTLVLTKGHTTNVDEMMWDVKRNHSLVAKGTVEALVLDRDDYFALRRDKRSGAKEYLSCHPILKSFPSLVLPNKDEGMLRLIHYPKGVLIFSGGTEYEWMYVIKSGECLLVRPQNVKNVSSQKKSLFNKRNARELGCERSQTRRFRVMADFRVWHKEASFESNKQDPSIPKIKTLEKQQEHTSTKENSYQDSISLPPIFRKKDKEKTSLYDVINPVDAAMLGVSTKSRQVLARPRPYLSRLDDSRKRNEAVAIKRATKSTPILLRNACLELGRLKPGDIFGLDNIYGSNETINEIALLSNGADVVKIKRRFFFQYAPANLLMQLSSLNQDFPSAPEAQKIIEEIDTWTLYKRSLIKVLTRDKFSLCQSKLKENSRSNKTNQRVTALRATTTPTTKAMNLTHTQRLAASAPILQSRFSLLQKNL